MSPSQEISRSNLPQSTGEPSGTASMSYLVEEEDEEDMRGGEGENSFPIATPSLPQDEGGDSTPPIIESLLPGQIPMREHILKLQMIRTSLVQLLAVPITTLEEVVNGCLVRVLLEIKNTHAGDMHEQSSPTSNDYHVAVLKGIKHGVAYSGFTWDHIQTDIHFVIELPPIVRTTPHGNHVQLNSISNSPIREGEYQLWVQQMVASDALIITPSQVNLRAQLLEQQLRALGIGSSSKASGKRKKMNHRNVPHGSAAGSRDEDATPQQIALRAQRQREFDERKERLLQDCREQYHLLHHLRDVTKLTREESLDLERKMVELLGQIRVALKEKSKCRLCREARCVIICYPCKHQVMCESCSKEVSNCPAPGCGLWIEDKIMPFSA